LATDYLIVGSGLSALVFGALMANTGKRVTMLEAHEIPGDPERLRVRLCTLFPSYASDIGSFLEAVELTRLSLNSLH
jgi:phytoene dehydrogenase-like protein